MISGYWARAPYPPPHCSPEMSRHLALFVVLFATAACSYPRFAATKTVDYNLPTAGVQRLVCRSHNGGITVVGDAAATEIRLHAEITARAGSQTDADDLLHQLDVARDIADGVLTVAGTGPKTNWASVCVFAFTITVPPRTALELQSHNGELRLQGIDAEVAIETHNGGISGDVGGTKVEAMTHNGDVRLTLRGQPGAASIETHNGEVAVQLDAASNVRIDADTHNGRVRCDLPLQDATRERNRLSGRLGDGKGSLRITTHNGDVELR